MNAQKINWIDLTVDDAERLRDFYSAVAGWEPSPVDMNGYSDYNMLLPDTTEPVAGICHARGMNAGLPAQWMIYITVADLEVSVQRCLEVGGSVVHRHPGASMCVMRDPAGAVFALYASGQNG